MIGDGRISSQSKGKVGCLPPKKKRVAMMAMPCLSVWCGWRCDYDRAQRWFWGQVGVSRWHGIAGGWCSVVGALPARTCYFFLGRGGLRVVTQALP